MCHRMIVVLCMFLLACSGDQFTVIGPIQKIDASESNGDLTMDGTANSEDARSESMVLDGWTDSDSSPSDSGVSICKDPNDVEYKNQCFYLDGSKGVCDQGYSLSSNAKLAAILAINPNAWQGKNYRHQISDNACVLTKDNMQNYGMVTHANQPGPFATGEPIWNGSSCTGVYFMQPKQLTLCESL